MSDSCQRGACGVRHSLRATGNTSTAILAAGYGLRAARGARHARGNEVRTRSVQPPTSDRSPPRSASSRPPLGRGARAIEQKERSEVEVYASRSSPHAPLDSKSRKQPRCLSRRGLTPGPDTLNDSRCRGGHAQRQLECGVRPSHGAAPPERGRRPGVRWGRRVVRTKLSGARVCAVRTVQERAVLRPGAARSRAQSLLARSLGRFDLVVGSSI